MRISNEPDTHKLFGSINLRSPFGPRDHAMFRLSLHTGLRVGEQTGLDICNVWSAGAARSWLDLPAHICKGGRSRQLPLNACARRAITDLVNFLTARGFSTAPDAPLLTDRRHRRLPVREVQRCLQGYRERAGLDLHITPHSLRHTFGSRLVEEGANIRAVQILMDHEHLRTTELYLQSRPDNLMETVELLTGP